MKTCKHILKNNSAELTNTGVSYKMDLIFKIFDMNNILVTIAGYKLSMLEFLGTGSGFVCVWLTAREKVISWPIGILNSIFFFVMFYKLRLYSDVFLQIYFFATSVYGWWKWTHPENEFLANINNELKITKVNIKQLIKIIFITAIFSFIFGLFIKNIHSLFPVIFIEQASYPYADSIVAVTSIIAQLIMARKKLECWLLWIFVDLLAAFIYYMKGINLVAVEYIIFMCIAAYGYFGWSNELGSYESMEAES